jgi:hypothetical protein
MSDTGFIYIGGDRDKPFRAKVGKTQRNPNVRISETTNPDYYLYHYYEVPINKLSSSERFIHQLLSKRFTRVKFIKTDKHSEWFDCSTQEADEVCAEYLDNQKSLFEKEKQIQEKFKAFTENRNAALEHYKTNYSGLESQLKEVIDDYQKSRNVIQTKLIQQYKSNKIDLLGIPIWLATYFLPLAIFSVLSKAFLNQSFWQVFLILAGIWALIDHRSIFNSLIKEKVNDIEVQKALRERFPDDRLNEAKLIFENLIAYQAKMKSLNMNERFPEIKYQLPFLKQKIGIFQSCITNLSKADEPKAEKTPEQESLSYKKHHSDKSPSSTKLHKNFFELEREILELELEQEIEKQEFKNSILNMLKGIAIITLITALIKLPKLLQLYN